MIAKRIALFALALLWPIISIVTLLRYLWLAVFNPAGAINVAIGVDQLLNTQLEIFPRAARANQGTTSAYTEHRCQCFGMHGRERNK